MQVVSEGVLLELPPGREGGSQNSAGGEVELRFSYSRVLN